ncbi:MAG: hypothetical protein COU47_01530 [Candidatus Niyogibacteria bacterium CG10_big_fil_rev_8_21_14_0_10_46_36]|uniref:Xylose isomerase-like TIM barrel domain-containing protein n=1 Tax=Candidatus Niyogibacteria bacterium CG10_big_fil_rev_8_21_14_0_10_46_36 TaxID=1974726 RepID=A0A2H0TG15_9BACT|nr:MAG: hypothetical protein COU47_01530 [Candidatus Niyogibacteria bacterium CG10_big_fil_rev_8_21_14_0_10_46_36]
MQKSDLVVGFSTGCLFKTHNILEALPVIRETGCNAVELNLLRTHDFFHFIEKITPEDIASFSYVSMHAPKFDCGKTEETELIFRAIELFHAQRPLDLIAFHPNHVTDFSVFNTAAFPLAFENLDYREESGIYRTVDGMRILFEKFPATPMVFDLNHVYTLDASMKLAKTFYLTLGKRIRQIHLSGCRDYYHYPLFKTKQDSIIRAIQDKTTPIIIESVLEAKELAKELSYIQKRL